MKKRCMLAIATVAASLLFGAVASAQKNTAEALFREALMKERAEGKLNEAIFRYERIAAEFPKERKIAAQALYQLSLAYEKLGDPRGQLMLTRLTSDYGNVEPYAGRGRTKLREMRSSSASPFPEGRLDEFGAIGSPDGRYILLIKILSTEQIYLRDLSTGKERLILEDPGMSIGRIAWSPDSRKVVYIFKNEINILQLETGQSTNLGVRGTPTAWTLTDEIFFTRTGKWFLVPVAGGPQREVTGGEGSKEMTWLTITPDATRIIRRQDEKLVLVDLATGKASPITSCTGNEAMPTVSPDGRLVAYKSNFEGSWALYVAPLDRGFPVKRPLKLGSISTPGNTSGGSMLEMTSWWSRDGLLTFAVLNDESNIYRVNMDLKTGRATEAPQRLTQDAQGNYFPVISPDGKQIAYRSTRGERASISVMDSNGANERPLLEEPGGLSIAWRSPQELLVSTKAQDGKISVSGLNLDSGQLQRVAPIDGLFWTYVPKRSEILSWPGWRPESEMKAVSLINGSDRTVAVIKNLLPKPLAVSPDGETIAYATTYLAEGSKQRVFDVSLMSTVGVQQGVLASAVLDPAFVASGNGADFAWSPDGRFLLLPGAGTGPKVMDLRTRQSWGLHEDSKDQSWSGGNWSPDGSFVVITKWSERRERVAWEGVTAEAVAKLMAANK